MRVTRSKRRGSAEFLDHGEVRGVLGLVLLVLALQALIAMQPKPLPLSLTAAPVIVVGVEGLVSSPPLDSQLPWTTGRPVSAAAVSEPARVKNECALSVWASLGAGRTTSTGQVCTLTVSDHRVASWPQLQAASADSRPDARLGTLASAVPGCVGAVGPDAAMAAARTDGTVGAYTTLDEFVSRGGRTTCGLTFVDPGPVPLSALVSVLRRTDATVVILGIRREPSGQAVEALDWIGNTPPGWLTSPSTRRTGVVTLPDLTRTLIAAAAEGSNPSLPVDGALLEVKPAQLSSTSLLRQTSALQAQPRALTDAAAVLGGLFGAGLALFVVARHRGGQQLTATLLAAALVLPAALALAGVLPWQRAPGAGAVLVGVVLAWTLVLTFIVSKCAQVLAVPAAVLAAGATLLVLTADAATGGLLQRNSLLDLRPLDGGRWYGFGNLTFAFYACAALVLVGHLLHRVQRTGHDAVLAVTVGVTLVALDGWPGAGADLGGALTLALTMGWLLLGLSRRATRGVRPLLAVVGAFVMVGTLAWLDWLRGPSRRTHLGAFVQRVLDADAGSLLSRKASAVGTSLASPWGLVALAVGGLVWLLVVRVRRRVAPVWPGFDRLVVAVLATAALGTVLNDSGVVVWAAVTGAFGVTVLALVAETDQQAAPIAGWRRRRPTGPPACDPARRTTPGPGRA